MFKKKIDIASYSRLKVLLLSVLSLFQNEFLYFVIKNLRISYSQVFQDLFVLYVLNFKKRGVFIEIGGGDGKNISNTYLLEKKYFWRGLICEPDKRLHDKIKKYRRCKIVKNPIADICKSINFYQSFLYGSSIKKIKNSKKIRLSGLCLNHLIEKNIKQSVDYISIDTEGNEYDIIKNFNFKKFEIKIFTIEHNFNKNRNKIYKLMCKNGYSRKYKLLSYMDDWYVSSKK